MNNHYHLVIETPDGNLASGMRQLNGVYTQDHNRKHHRTGHIFEGRYKSILVEKESHCLEVCRYVVLNPVRAAVVSEAGKWKWSSYRGTTGRGAPHGCLTTDWVLAHFGNRRKRAQKLYEKFVKEGVGGQRIYSQVRGQILREEDFVDKLICYVKGYEELREIPKAERYISRPSLERLFHGKGRKDKGARDRLIKEAVKSYGYNQREVAEYLKMHYSTISKIMA